MGEREEIENEIELARKSLEEDVVKKEIEAEEKLDEILSKGKMEFCSRCGRKIDSRLDWGGKCLHEGCENLICKDCWILEEKRFCRKHMDEYTKKEEKPKEERPKEEIEKIEENKIKSLTLNYMSMIEERFKKNCIDFTREGFLPKTKFKIKEREYGRFRIVIYKKGWIFKRAKIQIFVKPLELPETLENDVNIMLEDTKKRIHTIVVFVSSSYPIKEGMTKLVEGFSNKRFSLFLEDFESGKLYFNPNDKMTKHYASWFDPNQTPKNFRTLLENMSEKISGRYVISIKTFSKEFEIPEKEGKKILKRCKFLSFIKDTDSFLFREK
jgi:hypothetical protein